MRQSRYLHFAGKGTASEKEEASQQVSDGLCCNLRKAQGGRLNALRHGNPTCDFQVATDRASPHPVRGSLVPAVFRVAAGCGGTAGGTRAGSGSYDRVALGTALFARTGTAAATPS